MSFSVIATMVVSAIAAFFGVFHYGKSKGKKEKEIDYKRMEEIRNREKAENERNAVIQSNQITKEIDEAVNSGGPGASSEWLRKNANRDNQ